MVEGHCVLTDLMACAYQWQTLIAGVLAIVAAWLAVRPVWQQVQMSKRDILDQRANEIERIRKITFENGYEITECFLQELSPHGEEEKEPDVNHEWAFAAEYKVRKVLSKLTSMREHAPISLQAEEKLCLVIHHLKELHLCLKNIHEISSHDLEDYTADKIKKMQEDSKKAEKELKGKIDALKESLDNLDGAFKVEVEKIRFRRKKLDEGLFD